MIALPQPDNRIAEQDASRARIIHGDALVELRKLPTHSVDSIVTDPPCGIAFMGKEWDNFSGKGKTYNSQEEKDASYNKYGKGALPYGFSGSNAQPTKQERENFIKFIQDIFTEALRVIKPGGHAFVWALPRTSHWTATALENAGFQIKDIVTHIQGQGFPKSHDISKAIDNMKGAEREVVGRSNRHVGGPSDKFAQDTWTRENAATMGMYVTAPATPEAQQWSGFGTALKPCSEHWILCRAPLAEKSIAANVLRYGVGAINIDISRVGIAEDDNTSWRTGDYTTKAAYFGNQNNTPYRKDKPSGRWPSNVLLSHSLFCQYKGVKRVKGNAPQGKPSIGKEIPRTGIGGNAYTPKHFIEGCHADADGMGTVPDWQCAEGCPIAEMDRQSGNRQSSYQTSPKNRAGGVKFNGNTYNNAEIYNSSKDTFGGYKDEGGASRYFQQFPPDVPPFYYCSKPSRAEKNRGCEGLPEKQGFDKNTSKRIAHINHATGETTYNDYTPSASSNNHPTVKSTRLIKYLCSMITPPNGVCLDFFAGSGTTGVACIEAGFDYILIEQSVEYVDIINARIAYAEQHAQPQEQEVGEWECAEGCMVKEMDRQSGKRKSGMMKAGTRPQGKREIYGQDRKIGYATAHDTYGDEGGASRFFAQFPPSLFDLMEPSGVEVEDV